MVKIKVPIQTSGNLSEVWPKSRLLMDRYRKIRSRSNNSKPSSFSLFSSVRGVEDVSSGMVKPPFIIFMY